MVSQIPSTENNDNDNVILNNQDIWFYNGILINVNDHEPDIVQNDPIDINDHPLNNDIIPDDINFVDDVLQQPLLVDELIALNHPEDNNIFNPLENIPLFHIPPESYIYTPYEQNPEYSQRKVCLFATLNQFIANIINTFLTMGCKPQDIEIVEHKATIYGIINGIRFAVCISCHDNIINEHDDYEAFLIGDIVCEGENRYNWDFVMDLRPEFRSCFNYAHVNNIR